MFSRKTFLLHYDLQQVDKVYLCKQRWNIYLCFSTWSFQNLAFPAGFPVDLMTCFDQITTSYTNYSFSLFSLVVFKLFILCASLWCTISLLMLPAVLLIFCFIRLLSLTLPMCNQASNKFNVISRQLIMYITLHTIIVIVQL